MPEKPPADVMLVVNYLLSSESELRLRQGVLKGKRVEFFKGKHAVKQRLTQANSLLRDSYKKNKKRPEMPDRLAGDNMVKRLLDLHLVMRVSKTEKSKVIEMMDEQTYSPDGYFIWLYQGSAWRGILIGTGVLAVVFAGVLFPLWPAFMRQGAYYVSLLMMGFLAFLLILGVIRAVLWVLLILSIGRGGWLFPNLFADVGFFESFVPLWTWDDQKKKSKRKTKEVLESTGDVLLDKKD